jgi:hypothetical protein
MMDKRIVFFIVFMITLLSTITAAVISILANKSWVDVVLYSLATMWIMGMLSQVLLQSLYHSIVKRDQKREQFNAEYTDVNLDDVEAIEDYETLKNLNGDQADGNLDQNNPSKDEVGTTVEQTG